MTHETFTPTREISADPAMVFACWAEVDLFKQWFTPPGVEVVECENILEPGGRAYCVTKLPDGSLMRRDGWVTNLGQLDALAARLEPT